MKFVLLLLVVVALVAYLAVVSSRRLSGTDRRAQLASRLRAVNDVAWDHDDISPALAGAVIDRTRGVREDAPPAELQATLDDVLQIARQHRADEPDLAVILIDTARKGGRELG